MPPVPQIAIVQGPRQVKLPWDDPIKRTLQGDKTKTDSPNPRLQQLLSVPSWPPFSQCSPGARLYQLHTDSPRSTATANALCGVQRVGGLARRGLTGLSAAMILYLSPRSSASVYANVYKLCCNVFLLALSSDVVCVHSHLASRLFSNHRWKANIHLGSSKAQLQWHTTIYCTRNLPRHQTTTLPPTCSHFLLL